MDHLSIQSLADAFAKKDAEIERLKQSKNILSDLLYKMEAKANRQATLITELCDALKESRLTRTGDKCILFWQGVDDLLQRAREATR